MPPLKSILVMADRSADAQVALQKAFVLARHFDARIELLDCDPDPAWSARGPHHPGAGVRAAAARRLDSRRFLEALRSSISADDLQIHASDDIDGPLHEGLARKVRGGGHNLVVTRVKRREGRRGPLLSHADWQVIRACPVPLMLTRGRPWRPLPRFVASVAGGFAPGEVLDVAHYFARGCQAALEIVDDGAEVPSHPRGADGPLARIPAPGDIDVVVLRAGRHDSHESANGSGGTLAESIVETLDCDVLLMPVAAAA